MGVLNACIEPFNPDIEEGGQLLVINGVVTDEEGYHYAEISQTSSYQNRVYIPLNDCEAKIIDGQGNIFTLQNYASGKYRTWIEKQYLQLGNRFKLEVILNNGKKYESEFDSLLPCPEIDSVYFEYKDIIPDDPIKQPETGLQFYIDYDATGDFAYNYRWEIIETWEYHSKEYIWAAYFGIDTLCDIDIPLILDDDMRQISEDCIAQLNTIILDKYTDLAEDSLYTCWKTEKLKDIFTYTSHQKVDKKVLDLPLHLATNRDNRLSIKYSALVKQLTLSDVAFNYWDQLKEQANETGGLYETQPFQLEGNIKCIDNEEEEVIGVFSVSSVKTKRFTGKFYFKPYFGVCEEVIAGWENLIPYLWGDLSPPPPITPLYLLKIENRMDTFLYVDQSCFDCRLKGGTLIKPEYW